MGTFRGNVTAQWGLSGQTRRTQVGIFDGLSDALVEPVGIDFAADLLTLGQ